MKALFIGRFQPFHKGHLKIVEDIVSKYDEIIIGIGSSQYYNKIENPYSDAERREMIETTLKSVKITNFEIISIPDIHDSPNWVSHVLSIINNFDVVISNNPLTLKLFSEQGFKVIKTPEYEKDKYSGKKIRSKMINGLDWEDLVPDPVSKIVKKIDGVQRLKNLSEN
jgi:nicotinamide-nucleotide adenylyltransferase